MDDESYASDAFKKISLYYSSPDAARFIPVFEQSGAPMDINAIENLLRRTFLE